MEIQISSELLDGLVLSLLTREDYYGYAITQEIQKTINISDSTMYPVLKRLQKNDWLTTYDQPFQGRNRRYYRITEAGTQHLEQLLGAWKTYKKNLDGIFDQTQIPPVALGGQG
ncbi:PadR family transcriptional regulator [Lentilactobacillus senioris]|nr:PadR family transcriptional regulator [Lentilactobacillus senioris]